MSAEAILSRLSRIKRTAPDKWVSCCPAHESKSQQSLAIKELDDGRVLLHCFGGCAVESVLGAVGLQIDDLFPPRDKVPGSGRNPERRIFNASDLVHVAAWESAVAAVVALDIFNGRADADLDRLLLAASRLSDVAEAAHAR